MRLYLILEIRPLTSGHLTPAQPTSASRGRNPAPGTRSYRSCYRGRLSICGGRHILLQDGVGR
jgi:hypothetical protein